MSWRETLEHVRGCSDCRALTHRVLLDFAVSTLAGGSAYVATLLVVWYLTGDSSWWAVPVAWLPGFYATYQVKRWQERQTKIAENRENQTN